MPMTKAAHGVYRDALEAGLGNEDFFATSKVLAATAEVEMPALRKSPK